MCRQALGKSFRIVGLVTVVVALMVVSCNDLTESIRTEVPSNHFFQNDAEFISALGDAYDPLAGLGYSQTGVANGHVATDEIIVGQKGADWEDGGHWIRMHRHTFRFDDPGPSGGWVGLYGGVNNANRLIFQFESLVESGEVSEEDAASFIAELKVLRAFYYYLLLDNYGNVPIVDSFADAPENPSQPSTDFQEGRGAVFDFVESEVLNNIDALSTDGTATYGRVNRWVAHMLLAKLYLNAEVYTGTPRWSDVIPHTDAIINSGNYSMAANYLDNFKVDNSGSPEMIFAIPYDKVFLGGFNLHMATLHMVSQPQYNLQNQPWNGFATMEEFYTSYIDPQQNPGPQGEVWGTKMSSTEEGLERIQGTLDERLGNFLVGPQYEEDGSRLMDPGATSLDPNGPPVTFTPETNMLEPNYIRQAGARIGKFEIEPGIATNMSNDFPIFRYTDVLLIKAEALWRMDNGDPEALALINQVRQRAGVDGFNALTSEKLLAERGREMFNEMTRRQDLIRFAGTNGGETRFNDPWKYKERTPEHRNVFPIPKDQLEANPNLVQNPGY